MGQICTVHLPVQETPCSFLVQSFSSSCLALFCLLNLFPLPSLRFLAGCLLKREEGGRGKSSTLLFSLSPKILFFPTPVLFSYSHQSHPSVDLSVCLLPLSPPLSFLPPPRVEQLSDPRARADRWTFPTKTEKKESSPPRLTLLCT